LKKIYLFRIIVVGIMLARLAEILKSRE